MNKLSGSFSFAVVTFLALVVLLQMPPLAWLPGMNDSSANLVMLFGMLAVSALGGMGFAAISNSGAKGPANNG